MIDFNYILMRVGGFGPYQIFLAALVCYYSIPAGFNSLIPVFINYRPSHRCNVPPIDNKTLHHLDEDEILNLTTPYLQGEYDTCKRYGYNLSECGDGLECVNKSADPIDCDMGYHYDTSLFPQTVITEFDLVCSQSYLDPLATSIYMVGVLLGSAIFGTVADIFGRKVTMVVSCVFGFSALIGCSFVHNFWLFVVCRFMVAFFGYGSYLSSFVYLLEITSSKWTTLIGVSFQLFFAIGYMILSGLAYHWRNWHELNLVTGILGLPYALFLFFIPESPRWLFSVKKDEKGKEITRKIAKYNKVHLDEPEIWNEAEKAGESKEKQTGVESDRTYSIKDLFTKKGILIVTLKVMLNWFVNSMVYYGISLNAGALAGDIFVNNTLNGVMEIAAYIFIILLMDRTGRRYMLVFMLTLAGVALLCSTLVNEYAGENQSLITLGVVFAFAGKIGISGSYAVIYNFTSELYPTVVRSSGVGVGSTAARIGSILAPFIIALQNYSSWLPNVIFGAAALVAAAMSFTFPETGGRTMMESLEEAEMFYAGKKPPTDISLNTSEWTKDSYENAAIDEDQDQVFKF